MALSFADVAIVAGVLGFVLYYLGTRGHDYWKKRGVPGPEPRLFFGTNRDLILFRKSSPEFTKEIYDAFPDEPYVGLLISSRPALFVRDPVVAKQILTKDFTSFHDRGVMQNEKMNPLSTHLFALEGQRWRQLRMKLTPTFTSGKMRGMLPLMVGCANELPKLLEGAAERGEVVDLKDVMARLTTDIIGTCAFGIECNSLKDPNTIFRKVGAKVFAVSSFTNFIGIVNGFFPKLAALIPRRKDDQQFFLDTVRETVQYREKNNVKRNDFMDLLIEIKKKGKIADDSHAKDDPFLKHTNGHDLTEEELEFTDQMMAAQCWVFFVAGFETSSSTMSFCLRELAHNRDIQEALQREVDEVLAKHNGEITYDAVMEMHYLDMVIAETLRKYPPLAFLLRKVTQPYQMPGSKFVLEKGTRVLIAAYGLHNDPNIFPDPDRFDPERFSKEAKANRHPYVYMPFGEGPRICIGQRFGVIQSKVGLAALLSRYDFAPTEHSALPVEFLPGSFVTSSKDGCQLRITRRRKV